MSLEITKGTPNTRWGTDGMLTGYGWVQSIKQSDGGKEVEIMRGDGEVVGLVLYDARKDVTIELLYDSTATQPVRGNLISVTGLTALTNCIIKNVELGTSNTDVWKLTVTATKFPLI
jgi:hypothetical protein